MQQIAYSPFSARSIASVNVQKTAAPLHHGCTTVKKGVGAELHPQHHVTPHPFRGGGGGAGAG